MYALVVVFVVSLLAAFPSQPQDSQSELAEIKALLTKLEKRIEEVEKRQLRLEQAIGRSPSQPSEKSVVGSADKEDRANALIAVEVSNKKYRKAGYEDYIFWDVTYSPIGLNKQTRAVKGVLVFADLFGEVKFQIKVTIKDPLEPGKTLTKKGVGFEYNQFRDSHKWMRASDLTNMKVRFQVQSILYADGTTEQLGEE